MKKLRIVDLLTSVVFSKRKRALISYLEKTYLTDGEENEDDNED